MSILPMRLMESALVARRNIMNAAGITFAGARDTFCALGYKTTLAPADYHARYKRNSVAGRVVEAHPRGTWRGFGELIEVENPKEITPFEQAWDDFNTRLRVWPTFLRLDILVGLGRYGILLIGAPGAPNTPLPDKLTAEQIFFLSPFSELDVTIESFENSFTNSRYGLPVEYSIKGLDLNNATKPMRVHWSRVIHVADGALDTEIYGLPRLERVWNNIDDLEKVVGAGSEAFWLRAHQGYQFDIDKETQLDSEGLDNLETEVDDFVNGIRRAVKTRGVKLQVLGSDVAVFDQNVESIISLISSGTGIPQRILMGSERGQLASQQDRVNWAERVQDRRTEFAGPYIVRALVDRLLERKVFPEPDGYDVRWPQIYDLSDDERAKIANQWATINQRNKDTGGMVLTPNEIRDRVLGMGPLEKEQVDEAFALVPKPEPVTAPFGQRPAEPAEGEVETIS